MAASEIADGVAGRLVMDTSETAPSYLWIGERGSYLKLSPSAYHLLRSVEAGASFETIAAALGRRQGRTVPAGEVEAAYRRLADQVAAIERRQARAPGDFWLRIPFLPARAVVRIAARLAPAFHPAGAAGLLAVTALCLGLVLWQGLSLTFSADAYWLGYALFIASLLVHEFGHAAACARYGARPSEIGFAVYWLFPVFYSDVSAAWRLKRWQRVVVDLGGAYLQAVVAAGYAVAYLLSGWTPLKVAIVMIVYSGLFILNPILKFDGYWLVADALGVVNLGRQPGRILRHAAARLRRRPAEPLPWPAAIAAILAAYTALAVGFWATFAWRLAPLAWEHLVHYPALLAGFFGALATPPHLPALGLLAALATSTYLLVVAWAMFRRLARPLSGPARTAATRLAGLVRPGRPGVEPETR
jgi:putative peptide zinc metalloprotease protein